MSDKVDLVESEGSKELVKLKDLKKYEKNPFIVDLNIPLIPKSHSFVSKDQAIININTGEVKEEVLLTGKRKYVDGEHFVKLFVKEMEVLFDLSTAAQKVFTYMLSKIDYKDLLHFDIDQCVKATGYRTKSTIFKAIAELCMHKFIAKTKYQYVYWINPKLFFKGDRLVVMREYRKSMRKKLNNNQLDLFDEKGNIQKIEAEKSRTIIRINSKEEKGV